MVLGMGREVLPVSWVWWTVFGIFGFAVVLFFASCAYLSHYLDGLDDEEDWRDGR